MLFHTPPSDFSPKFQIATCYIEHDGKILFVLRHKDKDYGKMWNIPGGKVNNNEELLTAVRREVFEETGIKLHKTKTKYLHTVYVRYPEYDYDYITFHTLLSNIPTITLKSDECTDHIWLTPDEIPSYQLVPDEAECVQLFLKVRKNNY